MGVTVASPAPSTQTCHSHLLTLPGSRLKSETYLCMSLVFDSTLGSTLHPLIPAPRLPFLLLLLKRGRNEVLLD